VVIKGLVLSAAMGTLGTRSRRLLSWTLLAEEKLRDFGMGHKIEVENTQKKLSLSAG